MGINFHKLHAKCCWEGCYLVRRWELRLNIIFASPCRRRLALCSGRAAWAPRTVGPILTRSGRLLGRRPRRRGQAVWAAGPAVATHARSPRRGARPAQPPFSPPCLAGIAFFPCLVDSLCAGNHRPSLVPPVMTALTRDGVAASPVRKKKSPSTAAAGCARLPALSAAIYLPRRLLPLSTGSTPCCGGH
ncbi:hypothetical protein MRX96_001164 [Rhipicephalus microplus]